MLSKKYLIILVSLAILTILCWRFFLGNENAPPQEIKVVEVEEISPKDISQTSQLIGTIKAKYSTILTAQEEGTFHIIAPAGSLLKQNDKIAKIVNLEIEKNYDLLLDAVNIAEEQYKRAQNLLKNGTYSKAELEDAKNKWINAQKNLADAKIALNKLEFFAPFDGIVGSYKVKEGQQLKTGDQIASFVNPKYLTVDFDIPLSILPNINNGQNLVILGKNYQLPFVQKMLDEDKHMSPASIDIECDDCIIGSNIPVDITVIEKKQVIVIPFDAVFLKNGKTCVYTIENNQTVLKPVELGIKEKELIKITSGLNSGEVIVTKGTGRLWPGLEVKIHKEQ